MQPFTEDRVMLRRDLSRVVGDGSLEVLHFLSSPRRVRREGATGRWRDYWSEFCPRYGACLLIVSDFGIGQPPGLSGRAGPAVWRAFADRIKWLGHDVVGFVPYEPARWPASLATAITLVPWDRNTGAARVRFARRRVL
jgi:hypothetical protein